MAQQHGENLKQAMDTLRAHKMRSALTVFGVVLGVSVIMLVAALITGFDYQIQENIKQFGADTAFVSKWDQGFHGGNEPPLEERLRKPLTIEGADLHREKVVMLGENVAPVLFPEGHPVGKDVMIDGTDFQVIGVVEKPKGGFGMGDEDRRVLIPISTFRKVYPTADEVNMRAQAYPKMLDQAVDQIREVLERRRNVPFGGKDNFSIATAEQQVEEFHNIVGKVALATVVLSSIGLLVGGIGVMNIMLVSVTERTREIGIRKAIGAKSGDITWQFLLEAMTLTGAGGVIALILVNALVLLIRVTLKWPGTVPVWAAATGVAVSVSIGLIFGVWPAMKAAKLDPVEALRYE